MTRRRFVCALVLGAAGEIDMVSAPELRQGLDQTHGQVIVDLRAVSFLDSSGIGILADARNRLRDAGGDLTLRKPQPIVRKALEVTRLADWIND